MEKLILSDLVACADGADGRSPPQRPYFEHLARSHAFHQDGQELALQWGDCNVRQTGVLGSLRRLDQRRLVGQVVWRGKFGQEVRVGFRCTVTCTVSLDCRELRPVWS